MESAKMPKNATRNLIKNKRMTNKIQVNMLTSENAAKKTKQNLPNFKDKHTFTRSDILNGFICDIIEYIFQNSFPILMTLYYGRMAANAVH